jgi:predicted MFS family arabinose efflux permease
MLAICEPIGGIVADQFGLRAVFLVFAVMTATFAFPLLFFWDRAEREQAEREALSRELLGREREAVAV